MGQFVFDENLIGTFSFFLAFKHTKEHILIQAHPLQIWNKKIILFSVTVDIFWGPAPS